MHTNNYKAIPRILWAENQLFSLQLWPSLACKKVFIAYVHKQMCPFRNLPLHFFVYFENSAHYKVDMKT